MLFFLFQARIEELEEELEAERAARAKVSVTDIFTSSSLLHVDSYDPAHCDLGQHEQLIFKLVHPLVNVSSWMCHSIVPQ